MSRKPGAMGYSRLFTAPVLLLAALPARSIEAQQATLERRVHQTVLENGLQVIVVENQTVPLATVLVAVRNGAFTQDSAEQGLAHLYEHILFRSFHSRPEAFALEATRLNGRFNGATTQEVVFYFVMVPSKNVEGAIKLMAELLKSPRFSNDDLENERLVVLDELHRSESDPEQQLSRQVERTLWGTSWSRKDVAGDSGSLAGITVDRLNQTYGRFYIPNNAALIVTGDVSSDRVFEEAQHRFGDWKRGPDPFVDRPIPPMAPRIMSSAVILAHDVPDVTIHIAMQGPSVGQDTAATYAGDALFEVLNDPSSAFQRVLVDSGLFQSIVGHYLTLSHTGPIEIVGRTTTERAQDALAALVTELDNLEALAGISDEALGIVKKRRQVERALKLEGVAALAPELGYWWSSAGLDHYLSYDARMRTESPADLERFVRTYITGRPRVIGVLAPPETAQRVAEWLRRAGRTTSP